ncbi:PREDICTED: polyadenylate-binding protein 4 [Tarenaya hassleriana]|uniref:polyadenylate-binding protein 4 n=1 Tax=Tarenaya hassleriana TaxID=28532 RepID=UPI00053C8E81|nr:PREDICTED: polyadenylate-binding protein 4 [Tarenaya hassleriana]
MAQVQAPSHSIAPPLVTAAATAAAGGDEVNHGALCSLYVGDLELNVTDSQLYDYFNQVGQVVSVRVCRDAATQISLGYGYVNYSNTHDAERATKELNFSHLNGKMIRVTYSSRDNYLRRSGIGNLFVKNLDKSIDNKALHDTFSEFGNILSCKVATDHLGQSRGHGFVQFEEEDSAKNAINKLNGTLLNDKQIFVGPFLRKEDRESGANKIKFNNVYVKNLSETSTDDDLKNIFGQYGYITSAVVMRDGDGRSKCFGFVNFESPEDAARSVEALNGKRVGDKEWYVGKAQKKSERELELRGRFEQQGLRETGNNFEGLNLYVKNLDDSITDEKLRELFSEFGTITSCKVMREPSGISKGSGFVAFLSAGAASRALSEMNGKMVGGKPLYVALAQRKEERRAKLQAQFSQMRPALLPAVSPHMPIYPGGAPGLGQQLLYGQGPPPMMISQQPGFGYQPQLVPGMRPNVFGPTMQPGQRPGGRRSGGGPMRQSQQLIPLLQPQMLPRGRGYRYSPVSNMLDGPIPGGILPIAYDMNGMPFAQPLSTGALASALANGTPAQQRTLLGEHLYPLVDQMESENAAKVTGMLLEMDQTEVLHLIESPDALKAKVAEAMDVLRNVGPPLVSSSGSNSPIDKLASLSMDDKL